MVCGWLLVVVVVSVLCGAGQGAHYATDGLVLNHLQRTAADIAALYLPVDVSPTSPCGRALNTMATALLANNSLWAANMVDAWGKTADGFLIGNFKYNGVYDQCLGTTSPDGHIKGKYCRIHTYALTEGEESTSATKRLPMEHTPNKLDFTRVRQWSQEPRLGPVSLGLTPNIEYCTCIPHVCTTEELQTSLFTHMVPKGVIPAVFDCTQKDTESQFTDADVGFMSLLTFLLVVILCASLVDIYIQFTGHHSLAKGVLQYLLVFSAYTNVAKILQVNPKSSPGNITCLHAMRTLSMTWVIWCHQQTVYFPSTINLVLMLKNYGNILAQTLLNGYLSVDTFFFLSGLLVSYSVLRAAKRTGSFNILLFYIHRILRLIPPIAIFCGFEATMMRFLVSGMHAYMWTTIWQPMCAKHWWRDVTFVTNFNYEAGSCLGQTWYIAADMQMYLVAPIIILPLYFYNKIGKAWLFVVTAVSVIIPAAIIYKHNLPPIALMGVEQSVSAEFFNLVYLPPWTRAGPWVAGIWVGYILYKQGNTRYMMSPLMVTVGWTLAAITGLLVVFGLYNYNNDIFTLVSYEMITAMVYGGGHRLAWGAALGWVVIACHNGYGGLVNDFLSHPVWQPISRLTYTTYLVALPFQYVLFYSNNDGAFYFTHLNMTIITVSSMVLSLPLALMLSLIAESPTVGLEKLLLTPRRSSSPNKTAAGEQHGDTQQVPSKLAAGGQNGEAQQAPSTTPSPLQPHLGPDTPITGTPLTGFVNHVLTIEEETTTTAAEESNTAASTTTTSAVL